MRHANLLIVVLTVCAIAVGAGQATAQSQKNYNFFVTGELAFAISPEDFTDYYNKGFGFGFGLEYPVSPNWSLVGLLDLKLFSPAAGMIKDWWTDPGEWPNATNIEVSEGKMTAGSFAVLGKGSLKKEGARFFPYIKGGFGITVAGADEIKVTFDSPGPQTEWQAGVGSNTNLSIILGIGVEKMLGQKGSSFFIDAGLHMIMAENVNPTVAPLTIGFKF